MVEKNWGEGTLALTLKVPLMVRLKQPSRSPDKESAPHWSTTAEGWYISITLAMIYTSITKSVKILQKTCHPRKHVTQALLYSPA
jgi:hypothetical protein